MTKAAWGEMNLFCLHSIKVVKAGIHRRQKLQSRSWNRDHGQLLYFWWLSWSQDHQSKDGTAHNCLGITSLFTNKENSLSPDFMEAISQLSFLLFRKLQLLSKWHKTSQHIGIIEKVICILYVFANIDFIYFIVVL